MSELIYAKECDQLGVLINFGHHPGLEWKRIVRSKL